MTYALIIYVTGIIVFLWREWLIDRKSNLFVAFTWPCAFIYLTAEDFKRYVQAQKDKRS